MLNSQAAIQSNQVNKAIKFLSENNASSKQKAEQRKDKSFFEKLMLTSSITLVAVLGFLYLVAKKGRAAIGFIMEPLIRAKLISYGFSPKSVEAVSRDNFASVFSPTWIGQYLSVGFEVLFKRIDAEGSLKETENRIREKFEEGESLSHFKNVTLPKLRELLKVEQVLNNEVKQGIS